MIVLNPSKVKLKFQEKLDIYKDMKNFGSLECPCCHSKEYILWGFYERGITYMKQAQIYSETVKIQRIRCKSCGKTHAILPFGIVPYKQLTDEIFILLFLEELPSNPFTEETKSFYKKQFFKYHLSCLKTMLQMRNTGKILLLLKEQKEEILSKYIQRYEKCFMQIKLGYLGYGTS